MSKDANEYSSKTKREDISAEEISKTLDKFGSGPPYEFQTKASRRRGKRLLTDHCLVKIKLPADIFDKLTSLLLIDTILSISWKTSILILIW